MKLDATHFGHVGTEKLTSKLKQEFYDYFKIKNTNMACLFNFRYTCAPGLAYDRDVCV